VQARFGPLGDSVSVSAGNVHGFVPNIPQAQKSFWTHPMVLLGDEAQVEARLSPFRDNVSVGAR
jgi:hypothetical protein